MKLHLPAVNGGPFNCRPFEVIEVDDSDILCNDVTLPEEFNPHNVRLWVIRNGTCVICVVWASHEQNAFDIMVDEWKGCCFLVDEEEEGVEYAYLGNAGECANLECADIREVEFKPSRDWKELCAFAEARGGRQDTLFS